MSLTTDLVGQVVSAPEERDDRGHVATRKPALVRGVFVGAGFRTFLVLQSIDHVAGKGFDLSKLRYVGGRLKAEPLDLCKLYSDEALGKLLSQGGE